MLKSKEELNAIISQIWKALDQAEHDLNTVGTLPIIMTRINLLHQQLLEAEAELEFIS